MSSYLTVLIRFIVPMALLCGGGLVALALIKRATPRSVVEAKRPALVGVLVLLWGLGIGSVLFQAIKRIVAVVTGDTSAQSANSESLVWFGVAMAVTAVLVAAAYALFHLRRSSVVWFGVFVILELGRTTAVGIMHPEALRAGWASPLLTGNVLLGAFSFGYCYYLKSRALLA
jgi:hypothetical protein